MLDATVDIEVGHVADPNVEDGGGLRLWRAREALRQAEQRLQAQAAALTTLETRAQALVGWTATALTALVGAFFLTGAPSELRLAAVGGAVAMGAALFFAFSALTPDDWAVVGHDPNQIRDFQHSAELYDVEAMASGYARGIACNSRRMAGASEDLRNALLAVAFAPVTAFAAGAGWAVASALRGSPA